MKVKTKLKQICASVLLVLAIFASCSYQTLFMGSVYLSNAYAKTYVSEDTVTGYDFTSTGKWGSAQTNYAHQIKVTPGQNGEEDKKESFNALNGSTSSKDLTTLDDVTKPAKTSQGISTTLADGEEADSSKDYKTMYIVANSIKDVKGAEGAEGVQFKDVKDDKKNPVYHDDKFVMDGNEIKYYNSSDIDTSNPKYVPVSEDEVTANPDLAGKYKEKQVKQEATNIYYYFKSSQISLSKGGYYAVSFYAYTTGDAEFTMKISASDTEKYNAIIEEQKSTSGWTKYYLFLETRADASAPSVYIYLYLGNEESILGSNQLTEDELNALTQDSELPKVAGSVYIDNLEFKTINETDFNNRTIDGKTPSTIISEENTKNGADVTLASISANNETNFYSTARYYTGLLSNPDFATNSLVNLDNIGFDSTSQTWKDAAWKYYVPEYIDGSTSDKLSSTTIAKYQEAYTGSKYVTISTVNEESEIQLYSLNDNGEYTYADDDTEKQNPLKFGFNTFNTNNSILKVENNSQLYSLGLVSNSFTILQYRYYKISVWVKATDEDSSASVVLFGKVPTGDKEEGQLILKSQSATDIYSKQNINEDGEEKWKDSSTIDRNNGWTRVDFYVHGNAYQDMTVQLALLANKNSTVYFDHITVESILSSEMPSSSTTKLDLTHSPTKQSSEQQIDATITNGYFDLIETTKVDFSEYSAPYTAQSWTLDADNSKDVVAGIVPTNANYDSSKIGNASNPNLDPDSYNGISIAPAKNNVFAIYAPSTVGDETDVKHNFKMTTKSTFSLSGSSVYKLTFKVNMSSTAGTVFSGKMYANLTYNDNKVSEFVYDASEIDSSKWVTFSFIIRTGSASRSTKFSFGVEDAQGTIFIKNIGFYKYSELTRTDDEGEEVKVSIDEQYSKLLENYKDTATQKADRFNFVDFKSYNFTMHSSDKISIDTTTEENPDSEPINIDFYESFSHKVEENPYSSTDDKYEVKDAHGFVGVVNSSSDVTLKTGEILEATNIANPKAQSDTALIIYNDGERYTTVTPRVTYSLDSSSFYTIEVYVKTSTFAENKGLTIKMGSISVEFNKVDTTAYGQTTNDTNGYELYKAIVRTGKSAIAGFSVDFVLGTMTNKLSGWALVSDITVTKLADEKAFNEIVDALDKNDTKTVVKNFYIEENKTDSSSTLTENNTLVTFFLVFSSILLVVAIVIAMVALYIRKHPKKATVKVSENDNNYKAKRSKEENEDPNRGGFV